MLVKIENELSEEVKYIRETVFMKEQGFKKEFDEIDKDCFHLLLLDDQTPVGTCRMYEQDGVYYIGRVAIMKEYRGQGLGSDIMDQALYFLENRGVREVVVSAQKRVQPFYESLGFEAYGDVYLDEYCEHIHMKKVLL